MEVDTSKRKKADVQTKSAARADVRAFAGKSGNELHRCSTVK